MCICCIFKVKHLKQQVQNACISCYLPDFSVPNASYLVMQQLKNVHIHRNIYKGARTQNVCGPSFPFLKKIINFCSFTVKNKTKHNTLFLRKHAAKFFFFYCNPLILSDMVEMCSRTLRLGPGGEGQQAVLLALLRGGLRGRGGARPQAQR